MASSYLNIYFIISYLLINYLFINSPPKDAIDPDEWRDFFSTFDDGKGVTLVTIMLNNTPLLRALKARRYFRKELQRKIPNLDLNNSDVVKSEILEKAISSQHKQRSLAKLCFNCSLRPILRIFGMYLDPEVLLERINQKTTEIKLLQKQNYDAFRVIVTFESEAGKRTALETLQASRIDISRQNTANKHNMFRGKHLLDLVEPSEPTAMRYLDVDVSVSKRIFEFTITLIITLGLIALGGYLVYFTRQRSGAFYAGILTTTLNILIPFIVNLLMIIEHHSHEDDRQRSLYIKVTIFRWVNTGEYRISVLVNLFEAADC